MSKWTRWILGILVVIAAAYYWLFVESHLPSGSFSIDMAEVRKLANSIPGAKPQAIHVEQVATFTFPAAAIMAGSSWQTETAPAISYQVLYPDHSVIVDTAMDQKITIAMGRAAFQAEPYARMTRAMGAASLILITHEHPDHIGGIAGYPDPARFDSRSAPDARTSESSRAHGARHHRLRIPGDRLRSLLRRGAGNRSDQSSRP